MLLGRKLLKTHFRLTGLISSAIRWYPVKISNGATKWSLPQHGIPRTIRAVAGQRSSPELYFADKTKIKKNQSKKVKEEKSLDLEI